MNYCTGERNVASTLCNPCPYDYDCEECRKEMEESAMPSGLVTLEWAASTDFVFVEIKMSKNKSVIAPASVILSEYGGYEIHFIDNVVRLSEENYGKTWRCWQMDEPHPIDREREPWK